MADATFRAGGLASGIDSNALIEQLMALESRPITQIRTRQSGMRTQVSTLGDIISKVKTLQSAAQSLATGGVLATKVQGENTGFTATSGSGALAGQHGILVEALATSHQSRSAAFTSATSPVRGGTLTLNVKGTAFNVNITDGSSLSDVAFAIRQTGAPVTATVINDGTNNYLSIVNNESGYPLTGVPGDALSITENYTGSAGNQALALATTQAAGNARFKYNGLTINRQTNTVSDIIPGVTLNLKQVTTTAETLNVVSDTAGTVDNLKKFVDSYNSIVRSLQSQLQVTATTDRSTTLAGDSALRSLQTSLQRLVTTQVGSTSVRSLADIGIKSERDGSLVVDNTALEKAVGKDAGAINNLFAQATGGLAATIKTLADNYTKTDGILASRRTGIESNIKRMDSQIVTLEMRVEARRTALIAQFTAMEKVVSSLKSTGNFLAQQNFNLIDTGS